MLSIKKWVNTNIMNLRVIIFYLPVDAASDQISIFGQFSPLDSDVIETDLRLLRKYNGATAAPPLPRLGELTTAKLAPLTFLRMTEGEALAEDTMDNVRGRSN